MVNPKGKTIHIKEDTHQMLINKQTKIHEKDNVFIKLSDLADMIIRNYVNDFEYKKLMICPNAYSCTADCKFGHRIPHIEIGSCIQHREPNCPGCKVIIDINQISSMLLASKIREEYE